MECPECKAEIGNSTYCGCGWGNRDAKRKGNRNDPYADPPPYVPCAHDGCRVSAMCKIQTPTGFANLCPQHYDEYFQRRADATCERLGLKTVAEKRAWVRSQAKRLSDHFRPPYMREPGEDEEEAA